jgi:hypothetical protein
MQKDNISAAKGVENEFSNVEEESQDVTLTNHSAELYSESQQVASRWEGIGSIAGDLETEPSGKLGDYNITNGDEVYLVDQVSSGDCTIVLAAPTTHHNHQNTPLHHVSTKRQRDDTNEEPDASCKRLAPFPIINAYLAESQPLHKSREEAS